MARANSATLDGLYVGYGARDTINPEAATVHTKGNQGRELQVVVDVSNYLGFATSTAVSSTKHMGIPAGAVIRGGRIVVTEAVNNLTSIDVGLKEFDGTEIDADGLADDTLLAALTAGAVVELDGALLSTALADAGYLSLDVTGTAPTTGELHIYIEYDMPVVDQDAPDVITGEI